MDEAHAELPANITRSITVQTVYARLKLCFHGFDADITQGVFTGAIKAALQSQYGTVGGRLGWSLVQHHQGAGIVKVARRDYSKFAAAAAWLSEYSGRSCHLKICAVSHSLAALAADSDEWIRQLMAS